MQLKILKNFKEKLNNRKFDIGYFIGNWKLKIGNSQQGFSLVEIILSASLFGIIATALVGAVIYGRESAAVSGERARAIFLTEEGLEAVRNIRDADFANLTDGEHGLAISGSNWIFSGTSDNTGIFTRQIAIISLDANRKKIVSTVSWRQTPQRNGSVSLTSYLTNWRR